MWGMAMGMAPPRRLARCLRRPLPPGPQPSRCGPALSFAYLGEAPAEPRALEGAHPVSRARGEIRPGGGARPRGRRQAARPLGG
eukprot:CAMPEP_0204356428 /NCGR_PEP_ID=MMETSP0469-20131031/34946_1 /ASSEMBLY_ACC=CAM_ASM_000384 /TAXON_ID=2969 /ORGANISM="Oxyrrhis marina" /LENGTH=83 /DNA_ID=CAMNT_0051343891 /DNA_START=86 /DNA_END=337 /DNA_ORIENTATION=-